MWLDWESQFYHRQLKRAGWGLWQKCGVDTFITASMPIQNLAKIAPTKEKSPAAVVSNADCVVAKSLLS